MIEGEIKFTDKSIPASLIKNGLRGSVAWNKWIATERKMARASMPIVRIKGKKKEPDSMGSGFILTSHDRFFLISAAHVWDEARNYDENNCIALLADGCYYPLAIWPTLLHSTPGTPLDREKDDSLDFAYKEVPREVAEEIRNLNVVPIHIKDCLIDEVDTCHHYTISGFPSHWAKLMHGIKRIEFEPIVLTLERVEIEERQSSELTNFNNLVLDVTGLGHERTSQPINNIKLSGTSGGAVFALPPIEDWLAGKAQPILAGLVTGWLNNAHTRLSATRIALILNQMMHSYPELVYKEVQRNRIILPKSNKE